jgi:ribonuclease Z
MFSFCLNKKLINSKNRILVRKIKNIIMDESNTFTNKRRKRYNNLVNNSLGSYDSLKELPELFIISNGYLGSPKSFILKSKSKRYLFNFGEGTQRYSSHFNLKINKIEHVLLTRFDWSNLGGLHGFTKESNDLNVIMMHSPVNLQMSVDNSSIKKLISDKAFKFKQHDYQSIYKDDLLSIKNIEFSDYVDKYFSKSSILNKKTYSYLIRFEKSKPRLKVDELLRDYKDLKITNWMKDFIKGIDYKLEDGSVIKASEYLDYSDPNCINERKILILDLPTLNKDVYEFLSSSNDINNENLLMIVHMSNKSILNDKFYLEWLGTYKNKKCIHVFIDESYPNIDLNDIYDMQARLNLINPNIFPLLPVQTEIYNNLVDFYKSKEQELRTNNKLKILYGQSGMLFKIDHNLELDCSKCTNTVDNNIFQKKIFENYENDIKQIIDGIDKEEQVILNELKNRMQNQSYSKTKIFDLLNESDYPKIFILGTASACPSSFRNLSGYLMKLNNESSILMDCGEHTTSQLMKLFSPNESGDNIDENYYINNELINLKAIFISHNHLDHFNGLLSLIKARVDAYKSLNKMNEYKKLYLIYPKTLYIFLLALRNVFDGNLFDYIELTPAEVFSTQIQNNSSYNEKQNAFKFSSEYQIKFGQFFDNDYCKELKDNLKKDLNIIDIKTIPVVHIHSSYGLSIEFKTSNINTHNQSDSFKFIYSGDCRPTENLVKYGKECDFLLHECTFDNSYLDEAIKKKHSTISEALETSRKMNAKWTLLTHFSTRYGRISRINDINLKNTCFAFDFMYLSPKYFHLLNELLPYLNVVFKDHVIINEEKLSTRQSATLK